MTSTIKKRPLLLLGLNKDLYIRGIEKATVQIAGPKPTIDKFNRFCVRNDLTKWEAMEVLLLIANKSQTKDKTNQIQVSRNS